MFEKKQDWGSSLRKWYCPKMTKKIASILAEESGSCSIIMKIKSHNENRGLKGPPCLRG